MKTVIVLASDRMGEGDDALGAVGSMDGIVKAMDGAQKVIRL